MPTTNKELALNLITALEEMAAKTEQEMFKLNLQINPRFLKPAGKGALEYHLNALKDLVEKL